MEGYVSVGKVSEFEPGVIHGVRVGPEDIAVVNLDGEWHAFTNYCTHEALSFSAGYGAIAGKTIICMMHSSLFDLLSGRPLGGPASDPLTVYEVRIDGDDILIHAP